MDYSRVIAENRRKIGLSQSELAQKAEVSLPTIQKIEAGRANPSIATLRAVLGGLGFDLEIVDQKINWDRLATLGAPLLQIKYNKNLPIQKTSANLREQIQKTCGALNRLDQKKTTELNREVISLKALLLALKSHYPSLYKKISGSSSSLVAKYTPTTREIDGRLIKLARIATSQLAEYL